jgi:hypothetical protein
MFLATYAFSLFVPSAAILGVGILVLFIGWLSDKFGSRKERRVLEHFRNAMAASLPSVPQAEPVIPIFVASVPPPLPVAHPPPFALPLPIPSGPRRLRTHPPPLPAPDDEEEESHITGKYTPEQLQALMRRANG